MPNYKPIPIPIPTLPSSIAKDVGNLHTEFIPFQPDPKYSFLGARPTSDSWATIVPRTAPPIGDLPRLIKDLIKATWQFAEPSANSVRGAVTIGGRGAAVPRGNEPYHPQVRPTSPVITSTFPNDSAIASDWKVFNWIRRTNAVTFRGDSRSPLDVITKAGGFYPPNSRTDRHYLENNIYKEFEDYLQRRYARALTKEEFLRAVDSTAVSGADKALLVDYMMWRKITEREAVHLGRMVENECLKGYISTARSIDTSLFFAAGNGTREGWLYLTVIHGGFVVPHLARYNWGSEEAEIAQWGPIPADRIVGFVHVKKSKIPDGPIFIRRSFRMGEPEAFEHMFKVMSGMAPS